MTENSAEVAPPIVSRSTESPSSGLDGRVRSKASGWRQVLALGEAAHAPTVVGLAIAVIVSMAGGPVGTWLTILAAAQVAIGTASGFVLNELLDVRSDMVSKPYRPIVSRRLGVVEAQRWFWILNLTAWSMALVVAANTRWGFLLLVYGVVGSCYPLAKPRLGFLKNAYVAFSLVLPIGFGLLESGKAGSKWLLLLGCFLYMVYRELIMDVHDAHGDVRAGLVTFAVIARDSVEDVAVCLWFAAMITIALAPMMMWQVPVAVIGVLSSGTHLLRWSPNLRNEAWRVSIRSMWVSLALFIVLLY